MTTPAALDPGSEAELLDRLPGHDRDDPRRLRDVDLDSREQPVHLDRADDPPEPVARRQALRAIAGTETLDLGDRDDTPVGGVALDPDLPLPIPAAERVEADPERA